MKRVVLLLLATAAGLQAPAAAQSHGVMISVSGVGYSAHHRLLFLGAMKEQSGLWYGAAGEARVGRILLGGRSLNGVLSGDVDPSNPERTARVSTFSLHYGAAAGLLIGIAVEARRIETAVGTSVWRLAGPAVRLVPSFGVPGLFGIVDARVFPLASLTGGQKLNLATQGELGVRYTIPRAGLSLHVGYRLERFDFAAVPGAAARLEQVSGVVAGLGFSLGR